jgi:hypothetical protein
MKRFACISIFDKMAATSLNANTAACTKVTWPFSKNT